MMGSPDREGTEQDMNEMTPEEQAERIRRLQARRGTAADAPEVRRKRRRKHGMKTRVALTALTLASFGSLVGAMAVGQGSGTATVRLGDEYGCGGHVERHDEQRRGGTSGTTALRPARRPPPPPRTPPARPAARARRAARRRRRRPAGPSRPPRAAESAPARSGARRASPTPSRDARHVGEPVERPHLSRNAWVARSRSRWRSRKSQ